MSDILAGDATDLSRRIAAGEVSAVEVMQATLDRIAADEPGAQRYRFTSRYRGLAGRSPSFGCSPAKGLVARHSACDQETSQKPPGSEPQWGRRLSRITFRMKTADMVRRLKAAGGIVIGKTNTPEFGLGSQTFNPVHGVTLNPYDPALTCGGSSGGAAVALAHEDACGGRWFGRDGFAPKPGCLL